MKLFFRRIDIIDSSLCLVEAAINNYSVIKYASAIENYVSLFAEYVDKLRCLKANTPALSGNEPESLGYEKYDGKRYLEVVEDLFYFESEDCDDNHLNDQDYIKVVNSKYPDEYDRCIIVKSDFVLKYLMQEGTGKDFSYWTEFYKYSYKVIARKNVNLDERKEYSLDKLSSLAESRDILIVTCYSNETHDAEDYKKAVTSYESLGKLQSKKWLESVKEYDHPFHSEYMAYLKQLITEELINECLSAYSRACQKVLTYSEDKCIRNILKSYMYSDAEIFKGMNANQRLRFVKQYEKSHDLVNKARDIIARYSDEYKKYFA